MFRLMRSAAALAGILECECCQGKYFFFPDLLAPHMKKANDSLLG
jgi:hypothetical protein